MANRLPAKASVCVLAVVRDDGLASVCAWMLGSSVNGFRYLP